MSIDHTCLSRFESGLHPRLQAVNVELSFLWRATRRLDHGPRSRRFQFTDCRRHGTQIFGTLSRSRIELNCSLSLHVFGFWVCIEKATELEAAGPVVVSVVATNARPSKAADLASPRRYGQPSEMEV